MGKGDKKTKKGKINIGSFGKHRLHKVRKETTAKPEAKEAKPVAKEDAKEVKKETPAAKPKTKEAKKESAKKSEAGEDKKAK